jgi:hypothetical protein
MNARLWAVSRTYRWPFADLKVSRLRARPTATSICSSTGWRFARQRDNGRSA